MTALSFQLYLRLSRKTFNLTSKSTVDFLNQKSVIPIWKKLCLSHRAAVHQLSYIIILQDHFEFITRDPMTWAYFFSKSDSMKDAITLEILTPKNKFLYEKIFFSPAFLIIIIPPRHKNCGDPRLEIRTGKRIRTELQQEKEFYRKFDSVQIFMLLPKG